MWISILWIKVFFSFFTSIFFPHIFQNNNDFYIWKEKYFMRFTTGIIVGSVIGASSLALMNMDKREVRKMQRKGKKNDA